MIPSMQRHFRRGMMSWKQWAGSLVAIVFVGAIVFVVVSKQPPPPHFDELRIDPHPERADARSGPRLVVVSGLTRKVRPLKSGRIEFAEIEEMFGEDGYTVTATVPIELDEPIEAVIEIVFAGCTVTLKVADTNLVSGEESPLVTERLSFQPGVTDLVFEIQPTAKGAFCSLGWVTSETRGPEPLPPFAK